MWNKQSFSGYFIAFLVIVACSMIYNARSQSMHIKDNRKVSAFPRISLMRMDNPEKTFSSADIKGKVSVINVWATWCSACLAEHGILMSLKEKALVPIYGILWKDSSDSARAYLKKSGDPFTLVGLDPSGSLGGSLNLYGTPTTYIVDKKGDIRYRYLGAITPNDFEGIILPEIRKLQSEEVNPS